MPDADAPRALRPKRSAGKVPLAKKRASRVSIHRCCPVQTNFLANNKTKKVNIITLSFEWDLELAYMYKKEVLS